MKNEKQKRLESANQLIQIISSHGRRFFFNEKHQRTSSMVIDTGGKVYFIDDYTGKAIYTHKTGFHHGWRGFSHGGTLRTLVEMMRDYVTKGVQIPAHYLGLERSFTNGNIWGYSPEEMQAVRDKASLLPIIKEAKRQDGEQ